MGGRIDCYLDIASLYSYLGFAQLQAVQNILAAHSIEVEYHPVFLGGIITATGNKPPFAVPAKRKYGLYDAVRSNERSGKPEIRFPTDFLSMAMTITPLRALHFIKRNYPRETFETAFHYLFHCFWTPPHLNITKPDVLAETLAKVPSGFKGADSLSQNATPLFRPDEVDAIMQATSSEEIKAQLKSSTQEVLDRGAFGAPWLWVTNSAGHSEPFFGSDRFHFIYKFLDLPYGDVTLLPPDGQAGRQEAKL